MRDSTDAITRFFGRLVRRPVAVLMGVLALLGLGVIAGLRIPIELQPEGFASSRIWINIPWEGANPPEVEQRIVRPMEEELRTLRKVDQILASANQGGGAVIVSFPGNVDMDQAYAEVSDRVERVRARLPEDVDRIFIRRWTTADTPIMWCGVLYTPDQAAEAQDTFTEILQPRIESVDGVANVDIHGIEPRSVRILLDEDKVRAAGLDIGALVGRLQQDNVSVPVGDLDEAGSRYIVRVDGRFDDLAEIENFPIRRGLTIKDVGRVVVERSEPDSLFRIDGRYGLGLAISKESSANTFEVSQRLKRLFEEEIPKDPVLGKYQYRVFWNAGEAIRNSLGDLVNNAALGGLIACAVLMLFLRRIRYTLLIACSIPFSVLVTLSYLYFSGGSFNLFSMMGITISVGMLVDNSVVIVESIFKRREQGDSLTEAVTRGPAEVTLAVITATLTTVVVFLPLIFMSESRNARVFTASIGVPLCISLLAALGLSILIVPVASLHLGRSGGGPGLLDRWLPRRRKVREAGAVAFMGWLPGLVRWSLKNRFAAMALSGIFLYSGFLAGMGNEVRSNIAGFGGQLHVPFELAANTNLKQAEGQVLAMEKVLRGPLLEEIHHPTVGIEFDREEGTVNLWFKQDLPPAEEKRIREILKERLPPLAGVEYHFQDRFNRNDTEDEKWTRVAIEGPESATVARLADQVRKLAWDSEEYEEVAEEKNPAQEVVLTLDRERMQRLGVNSRGILGNIEWTLRGFMVSRFQTERSDIPLFIEFDRPEDPSRKELEELTVAGFDTGAFLPLRTLATFQNVRGAPAIYRENGKTTEVVGLKPFDQDLRLNRKHIESILAKVSFPEGYRWRQAGGWDRFQEDLGELKSAFILAIALVFFLMGLLFESLLLPFSVLLTIPFAVAGANWSFRLTGTSVDIIGWIGIIVLAGVVVNNGIVLLDRIIRLRRGGLPREEAILQGVRDRIRPVLMTALTTICGLLPIAFATPQGNGFSFQGLAVGVAGGMACTTFFTLWVIPLAYSLFDDLGLRLRSLLAPARLP